MNGKHTWNGAQNSGGWILSRYDFLKASGAVVAAITAGAPAARAGETECGAILRFGMLTDPHFANTDPKGSRYYRESVVKMAECTALMNDRMVDFLVELGDFKDQNQPADEKSTLQNLQVIEAVFSTFQGPRYHVLGNHDMDSISKEQFLAHIKNTGIGPDSGYYSFDSKGVHCIVLDANYRADGSDYDRGNFNWKDANIPEEELAWLKNDLSTAALPTIVFVHQPLDSRTDKVFIQNADAVRRILQQSKKVLAVFQGHDHAGHHTLIEGIHYYTLKAMVEGTGAANNAYAVVEVHDDHSIAVTGYSRAVSKEMNPV